VSARPADKALHDFARCAALAALHLVRAASPAPAPASVDSDGFAALLYGGAGARRAAETLRLAGEACVAVLAVRGGDLAESTRLRTRLRARIIAVGRLADSHIGDLNGTLFLIVPSAIFTPAETSAWLERTVLEPVAAPPGTALVAGVGAAQPVDSLPQSRAQAELGTFGSLELLRRHDLGNATDYVETLEAHVLTGGDARRAAELLNVHPNTYRYRMRRINELTDLDLDRIDVHAAVSIQLALNRLAQSQSQSQSQSPARGTGSRPPGRG